MNLPGRDNNPVLCFSQTGQRHIKEGMGCEDVCVTVDRDDFRFFGLADGQSGRTLCRIGGEAVLHAIADYIQEKGIQNLIQYEFPDEIQYELIRIIRETIAALSESHQAEAAEFSSTIVIAALDRNTGEYLTVHLGDGAIIGIRSCRPIMISHPENGITRHYTWLTTSADALPHLRICRGTAKELSRLVLLTDGATMFCRAGSIAKRTEAILCTLDNHEQIVREITANFPQDDASCIIIDL